VFAGRAVGRLHTQHGLRIGRRPLIVGEGDYAEALAAALVATGAKVQRIDGRRERVARALGRSWVSGAVLVDSEGLERQIECDLIAIVQPPAPAFELAQMHGASLRFDESRGFVVESDQQGRTAAKAVFVCGEVAGQDGVLASRSQGESVGHAVAAELG
jgi:hypothetical protein